MAKADRLSDSTDEDVHNRPWTTRSTSSSTGAGGTARCGRSCQAGTAGPHGDAGEEVLPIRHVSSIIAAAVVLAVLALSLWTMERQVFWSPDEGGKFFGLASLHWDGGITYAVPYLGHALDPDLRFFPRGPSEPDNAFPYPVTTADGGVRWHWPPWFPMASRPLFDAFGFTGLYLLPLLSGWCIALASGWIAHAIAPRLAAPTILVVGLATPVWFYSLTFWEHTLAACAGVLAVAVLVRAAPASVGALLTMLTLLFLAALLRIEMMALGVAAIVAWVLTAVPRLPTTSGGTPMATWWQRGRAAWQPWAVAALAVGVAGLLWLNLTLWLAPRQSAFFAAVPRSVAKAFTNLSSAPRSAVSLWINSPLHEGPEIASSWAVVATIALAACFVAPFVRRVWVEACLLVPALVILLEFSVSLVVLEPRYRSLHGFVPIAPFTAFWLYARPRTYHAGERLRTLARVACLYFAFGYAVLFAYRIDRSGEFMSGLEWGSRYLLALYPLLAVLAVAAIDGYARSPRPEWLRAAVTALLVCMVAVGLLLEIRGVATLIGNRRLFATWNRALEGEERIVTDAWWLPATLAPLFVTKETYFVRRRGDVRQWAALAAAHGIRKFTFATLGPVRDDELGPGVRRVPERCTIVSGLQVLRFEVSDVQDPTGRPP